MNPYKVNRNHHWNKEISADSVEQVQLDGRLVWECYLFAASGVTPKRVVEFPTKEEAYQWAISQGADIVTEFGLDRDNPDEFPIGTKETDCPNCADQASIAAPGETVLCKTHADEKHYSDMKEFFNDNLEKLEFHPYMPFCSQCGNNKPAYIGFIPNVYNNLVSFAFCVNCRDELTLKQNAARATLERISA